MSEDRGQSLFEVVFAVGIAALIIVGVVSLSRKSISNADFSKNNALATRYALEAREWIRQQRDSLGWDAFNTKVGYHCLSNLTWGNTSNPCGVITGTIFSRTANLSQTTVTINGVNYPAVKAEVKVRWIDGSGEHEVKDVSRYTNWNY